MFLKTVPGRLGTESHMPFNLNNPKKLPLLSSKPHVLPLRRRDSLYLAQRPHSQWVATILSLPFLITAVPSYEWNGLWLYMVSGGLGVFWKLSANWTGGLMKRSRIWCCLGPKMLGTIKATLAVLGASRITTIDVLRAMRFWGYNWDQPHQGICLSPYTLLLALLTAIPHWKHIISKTGTRLYYVAVKIKGYEARWLDLGSWLHSVQYLENYLGRIIELFCALVFMIVGWDSIILALLGCCEN